MKRSQVSIIAVLLIVIPLFFQNCNFTNSEIVSSEASRQLSSGGEGYDGKLKEGTYVQEVLRFGCKDITKNQRSRIVVSKTESTQTVFSALNCSSEEFVVDINKVEYFPDFSGYFSYQGKIFKNRDLVKADRITEVWCRASKNSGETLNFLNEYSLISKKSSNILADKSGNRTVVDSTRVLNGTQLSYDNPSWRVEVDLSSEIFLGSKKYNGSIKYKDQNREVKLFCYSGSGILPKTTYKKIDTSLYSGLSSSGYSKHGLSADSSHYYGVQIENEELAVKVIDLMTGEELAASLGQIGPSIIYDVKWHDVKWQVDKSRSFTVVLYSDVLNDSKDSLIDHSQHDIELLTYSIENGTLRLKNRVRSTALFYNARFYIFYDGDHIVWMDISAGKAELDIYQLQIQTFTQKKFGIDLLQFNPQDSTRSFESLQLGRRVFFNPSGNSFVFRVNSRSSSFMDDMSRLVYFNPVDGKSNVITEWGTSNSPTYAHWLSEKSMWASYGKKDPIDQNLVTAKVNRIEVESGSIKTVEEFSLDHYELHSVEETGSVNEVLFFFRPQHAYSALSSKIIKYDHSTASAISEVLVPANRIYSHIYLPHYDSLLVNYDDQFNGLNFFMSISDFTTEETISAPYDFGSFGTARLPVFKDTGVYKRSFIVTHQRKSSSGEYSAKILEYSKKNGSHLLDIYVENQNLIQVIEDSERVLMFKIDGSSQELKVLDLISGEAIVLRDRMQIPAEHTLAEVYPLVSNGRLLLRWQHFEKNVSLFYLVSIEQM